uniref:Uncharacterized protein n=1 Tax=virus sp. ctQ5V6 TaxID=2825815 RepID=A0A8S5RPV3_9VIRU|nr:MAG TPA: hypothetical protein [virus sp. ctQ5V6]
MHRKLCVVILQFTNAVIPMDVAISVIRNYS